MQTPNLVKKIVSGYPWVHERLLSLKYLNRPLDSHLIAEQEAEDNSAEIFTKLYSINAWGDPVSRSGPGSNLNFTRGMRAKLERFLLAKSVSSMLDAPCGDFVWMSEVRFPPQFHYVGGDIVAPLVDELRVKYGSKMRRFTRLDVTKDDLPKADLWLCRDCLIHLSNNDALSTLHNFVKSNIKFMMTTTYNFGRTNPDDISTGHFRWINLRRPPFSLPKPLEMITDYVYPFPPRRLAVWSHEQLSAWSANSPFGLRSLMRLPHRSRA